MRLVTFDEFLDAELAGLGRYATVLTGSRDAAHDVLADALVKAHAAWRRIGSMTYPLAYVRRIVTSTYLSEQRRWSVRSIRPTRTGDLPEVALPDPTDTYDDRAHLSALLTALPPRQRAAVVLRYYLGLDNASVATELGITDGAARTALSRGLSALRLAMDAETAEPSSSENDGTAAGLADLHTAARVDARRGWGAKK